MPFDAKAWRKTYPKAKAIRAAAWARRKRQRLGLPDEGDPSWIVFDVLHQLRCIYCGTRPAGSADHVMPLARGGSNTSNNLVPCCERCNDTKGNRTPVEWAAFMAAARCRECGTPLQKTPGRTLAKRCPDCRAAHNKRQLAAARLRTTRGSSGKFV